MKKICIILVMCVLLCVISLILYCIIPRSITEFSFCEYEWALDEFASDLKFQPIDTAYEAKKIAEEVWYNYYGLKILFEKPYKVSWDPTTEVWLIESSFYGSVGGVAYMLLHSNGNVLAVWHEK